MAWAPYFEKMSSQISQLGASEIKNWQGREISDVLNLSVSGCSGTLQLFSMKKIEKICIVNLCVNDRLQYGMCTILPACKYSLPIFFSRWEEREREITHLVDFLPTVDTFVDEEYRIRFLELMGPEWEKFASLAGICPEEDDELRSACSIIYTGAKTLIEKDGLRLAALAPHLDYLKRYCEFIPAAEEVSDQEKQTEIDRKAPAVRKILRSHFQKALAGPLKPVAEKNNTEIILDLFF